MDNNLKELLKKIASLAENGVDGEKANAQKMLDGMLKKHGISIEDVLGERTEYFGLRHTGEYHERLLIQIIKTTNPDLQPKGVKKREHQKIIGGNMAIKCTHAEFILIKQKEEHFLSLLKSEMDLFFHAFVTANNLLITPKNGQLKKWEDFTPEEKNEYRRVQKMADATKSKEFQKKLNS